MAVTGVAYGKGTPTKSAATDLSVLMLTVQDMPETVSHPVHPLKKDPGCVVTVSVTTVPPS